MVKYQEKQIQWSEQYLQIYNSEIKKELKKLKR